MIVELQIYWYTTTNFTPKNCLNQLYGLQKAGPRWSGSVPPISVPVLDWLRSAVACFGGQNQAEPDLKI